MTRPLICDVGEALFGEHWQAPLSRELHVSDRTIRRWLASDDFPPSLYTEMRELVVQRLEVLLPLLKRLQSEEANSLHDGPRNKGGL